MKATFELIKDMINESEHLKNKNFIRLSKRKRRKAIDLYIDYATDYIFSFYNGLENEQKTTFYKAIEIVVDDFIVDAKEKFEIKEISEFEYELIKSETIKNLKSWLI